MTVKAYHNRKTTRNYFRLLYKLWEIESINTLSSIINELGIDAGIRKKLIESKIISPKENGLYHWIYEGYPSIELVKQLSSIKIKEEEEQQSSEEAIDKSFLSSVSLENLIHELKNRGEFKISQITKRVIEETIEY